MKEKAEATDAIENPEECMLHEEKVPKEAFLIQKKEIVDKDKVRELEQKKQTNIIWPDELAAELMRNIYGQD